MSAPTPSRPTGRLAAGLALCAACLLGAPLPAAAQSAADVTTAREIAKEGMAAYDAGRYAEASDKLSTALEVVRVPTLALYAGKALAQQGRWVEASEMFHQATLLDPASGDPATQREAQAEAAALRDELIAKIPRLRFVVTGAPVEAVVLSVDGAEVPRSLWGSGRMVDPGLREIRARAGDVEVVQRVEVPAGAREAITLEFPPGTVVAAPAATPRRGEPGPAGTVPVFFAGPAGMHARARLASGAMEACLMPCTLHLPPGPVHVDADEYLPSDIVVPDGPADAEFKFKKLGLLISGAVVGGFGLLFIAGGVASYDSDELSSVEADAAGDALIVVGGIHLAIGAGLFIPGILSKKGLFLTPTGDSASGGAAAGDLRRGRPALTGLGVTPTRDGAFFGVTGRF